MYRAAVLRMAACVCCAGCAVCTASAKGDFDGPKRCSVCRYARKALVCTKDWKKGLSFTETLAGGSFGLTDGVGFASKHKCCKPARD